MKRNFNIITVPYHIVVDTIDNTNPKMWVLFATRDNIFLSRFEDVTIANRESIVGNMQKVIATGSDVYVEGVPQFMLPDDVKVENLKSNLESITVELVKSYRKCECICHTSDSPVIHFAACCDRGMTHDWVLPVNESNILEVNKFNYYENI